MLSFGQCIRVQQAGLNNIQKGQKQVQMATTRLAQLGHQQSALTGTRRTTASGTKSPRKTYSGQGRGRWGRKATGTAIGA